MDPAVHDDLPYGSLPAVDAPGVRSVLRTSLVVGVVLTATAVVTTIGFLVTAVAYDGARWGPHVVRPGAYEVEARVRARHVGEEWIDRYLVVDYRTRDEVAHTARAHYETDEPVPDVVGQTIPMWVDPNLDDWVTPHGPPAGVGTWAEPVLWATGLLAPVTAVVGGLLLWRYARLRRTLAGQSWRSVRSRVKVVRLGQAIRTLIWVEEATGARVVVLHGDATAALDRTDPTAAGRLDVAGRPGGRLAVRNDPWGRVFIAHPPRTKGSGQRFAALFGRRSATAPLAARWPHRRVREVPSRPSRHRS